VSHRIPVLSAAALAAALAAQNPPAPPRQDPIPEDTKPMTTTPSGLSYSVLAPGSGDVLPKTGDRVKVHYTGWLRDGTKFDSSRDRGEPFQFVLGVRQVIPGWDEGVALMRKGARHKLTIPWLLAYGEAGRPPVIPAKADLIFDVELLDFVGMPELKKGVPDKQKKTASGMVYEPLVDGDGENPVAGDLVTLRFAYWHENGKLIECSEQNEGMIRGQVENLPLKFLKEAVVLLRKGARYRFEVPAELAFGDTARGPDLPANSKTIWELELVTVAKVPKFELPAADKLQKTASGLQYEVLAEGDGKPPTKDDTVTVRYAGWLTDGTLFDASVMHGDTAQFGVGQVIPGWQEGLQLMKPGAVYRFVIPPALAYGSRGMGRVIGPDATLVFRVELVKVGT
jgi:FKBP-type peptidyl-prolyl cis-trans isomerase